MSREELEHSIAEIVNICACPDCPIPLMHKGTLVVVERLLAQEREKVRKRCETIAFAYEDIEDHCDAEEFKRRFRVEHDSAYLVISQLDLTKDLAASSREEERDNAEAKS